MGQGGLATIAEASSTAGQLDLDVYAQQKKNWLRAARLERVRVSV